MTNASGIPQLFLRIALGVGFLFPVMDRLGLFGEPGAPNVAWGDWDHFTIYTNSILPFLSRPLASIMGGIATAAEAVFGICLILGFKTKSMAMGSALLTLTFGICMMIFLGIYAPFQYPVFVFTGAALVLSKVSYYKWSVDAALLPG
ncbi:DoxX family protein [Pseudoflavitalea sp. G-6-1-2]|uniref:DoxX family protein n=1 Tax=Pseudoflavitalea sp. G-6-1-2 TaxID=2728841 RepID=UPI00146BE4F3|nr:DoxX family protein [Pseudoflavitalea sp. G-6-1-2]NML22570.1 DoxX family protein [Pseudoflavitalea sp. G-6-1-2]